MVLRHPRHVSRQKISQHFLCQASIKRIENPQAVSHVLIFCDRVLHLRDQIPGVHSIVDEMSGESEPGLPVQERPVDRCPPTIFRKQAGMQIHHAQRRHIECQFPQQVTIVGDPQQVRSRVFNKCVCRSVVGPTPNDRPISSDRKLVHRFVTHTVFRIAGMRHHSGDCGNFADSFQSANTHRVVAQKEDSHRRKSSGEKM